MPISLIQNTDGLPTWKDKDNQMITVVNSLASSGSVLSITSQTSGQVLVSNGTLFRNVTVTGDVTIDSSGVATIVGGPSTLTKGRVRFAGSMTGVY